MRMRSPTAPASEVICQWGKCGRQREESLIEIDNRGISCQIALMERDSTCHPKTAVCSVAALIVQPTKFAALIYDHFSGPAVTFDPDI